MTDNHRTRRGDERQRDSRSQSPQRHGSRLHRARSPRHHHHRRQKSPAPAPIPKTLPYDSRQLTKRDYANFKPMFELYLDIQKGKVLDDLDEVEVKGRWKSFIGKWNRGELSEGWYDPTTLQKAVQSATSQGRGERTSREPGPSKVTPREPESWASTRDDDSDSDASVGPALPGKDHFRRHQPGPTIPNMQDLELKREMDLEDGLARRDDIRYERKLDRKAQNEALEELVPRAEPGSRERQLEKKKEIGATMRAFREKSPGAAEVPDSELMGGADEAGDFKKQKQDMERKKNERELRREEILRARAAEREERLSEHRAKEDETMAMLQALAKQRFG